MREKVIETCENLYGDYGASDVEVALYSDDSERLVYIIPGLEVRAETDEYTFDPANPNHSAFAG